ncbi:MAG: alanine--tRNA ligase [Candidatus Diapherotrites archaeon]|uniref:alanine--tRNA ligase n=1 Tax=Candidatus Iainarchaeum sp. TaxID=3101447 RepID=A0A8T5GG04_9ARCH|nr:alanine--tRNA ligase [Candidatus Diapherotrites archaeon]
MTSNELREKYQAFFEKNGHARIGSASLIPENDPTVLFTTAGMHPLVPYLMGETHPLGKRLVNVQKCIRTGDIDEVGDKWHLSFFEMMGHWSLGDYFKKEAIQMSYEFLTKVLGLEKDKLSVTVFEGDKDAVQDDEAAGYWEEAGIPENRIHYLNKKENWWGPAGEVGPCGPDTEFFYRMVGEEEKSTQDFVSRNQDFPEIGNDVLMQYNKTKSGKFEESKQKNIDNGTGLERVISVLNGYENTFEIDTLKPIYDKVKELTKKKDFSDEEVRSLRIVTDHLRAAVMILGDDKAVAPSNVDQGYVLRKFIRRSIRHARLLGIGGNFCKSIAEIVIDVMKDPYIEVEKNKEFIFSELLKEEEKFSVALRKGMEIAKRLFETKKPIPEEKFVKVMESSEKRDFFVAYLKGKYDPNNPYGITKEELNASLVTGKEAFKLYQSYGFPLEMIDEIATEARLIVDHFNFRKEVKEHQDTSRKGAEQKFKGGLADAKEETTKLHTVTHLTLAAMKELIDKDMEQKGANINAERMRFDFNSDERLTDEQLRSIEQWVNKAITSEAEVQMQVLTLDEAKKSGAHGTFDAKYGDKVKVYTIAGKDGTVYSKEICGGPHVETLKGIGTYKIKKQESVAAGIKRIKAVLE